MRSLVKGGIMTIRTIFSRIRDAVLGPPKVYGEHSARTPSHEQNLLQVRHQEANQARSFGSM